MTVEELLQKLVDLAREGKGQYEVLADEESIEQVEVMKEYNQVLLT